MSSSTHVSVPVFSSCIADHHIQTQDVIELLSTHGGDFAAACSMDFSKPPSFYDTFALRDAEGHEAVTPTFPYFRAKASRTAMMSGQPVPLRSCWNGIGKPISVYSVLRYKLRAFPEIWLLPLGQSALSCTNMKIPAMCVRSPRSTAHVGFTTRKRAAIYLSITCDTSLTRPAHIQLHSTPSLSIKRLPSSFVESQTHSLNTTWKHQNAVLFMPIIR